MLFEDKRTESERRRDMDLADKRKAEDALALGFLKNVVRPLLASSGANVGLCGYGFIHTAEVLVESDGVTYRLQAKVDHDT